MVYVISDVHGEYDLFIKLLDKINFSNNDQMIICGDIIDKGQDSIKLLRFIKSQPNFRCVLGNHEYDFLKHYWSIMKSSTNEFEGVLNKLKSYFLDVHLLDWDTIDWLENLPTFIEEDNYVCVHAGIPLDANKVCMSPSKATIEQLVYDRRFKEPDVIPFTKKCIFFGHTPTCYLTGETKIIKYKKGSATTNSICDYYKIHLDLGVWLTGVLGCFCMDNCREYYVQK